MSKLREIHTGSSPVLTTAVTLTPIVQEQPLEVRKIHERRRKIRRTCNGKVPKTNETRRKGNHTLAYKSLPI